jgi:iron complex transport system substrate-binding protein
VEISLETIIDAGPDLVIGYETDTIKREGLEKAGIQLYIIPPYCKTPPPVSFSSIYDEVRFFGKVFENEAVAGAAATKLAAEVTTISASATDLKGKKAAALYVSSDGSALYAYSALGMVHLQMEALGLVNVFAEMTERVPEVSIEEIISRDPEILILLYTDTKATPQKITSLVADLPGAKGMAALSGGKTIPFLFNFSEPPSPLVVDGLSRLSKLLAP